MRIGFLSMLVFLLISPCSESIVFGGIADVIEDVAKEVGGGAGESKTPAVEERRPAAEAAPGETGEKPKEGKDEFYPGNTLGQLKDPETGNITSLVKMPDGTVKVVEKDPNGKIISEMELSEEDAERILSTDEDGVTTEIVKLPDGNKEIRRYDEDGNLVFQEKLPDESKMTKTSTYDPDTRITTTSELNEDGTRTITQTDEDGFVVSQETAPPKGQQLASASSYDPHAGITTSSQKNPNGSRTITRTDKDGNVISTEIMPPPGRGGATASMTDPKTGITRTSTKNPDGSRTITQTDKKGKVISRETMPPPGKGESYASSYDPDTGVTTVSRKNPDGSRTVSESRSWKDASGNEHTLVTDNKGNQTEVVTSSDGTKKTTRWDANGNETVTTEMSDGTTKVVERTDDGYIAETTTRTDGTAEIVVKDHAGNTLETAKTDADGRIIATDSRGVTTETSISDDGKTTTVMTDKNGNQIRTITDEDGDVLYSEETRRTPREPGQEYFENVLGGEYGDWNTLPESAKVQYANSERQLRENERMAALTAEQQAETERLAREGEARSAQQQKELEEKLAAIQREQEEADKRQRELLDRQELLRERAAAEARMEDYQRQLDEAIARGDKEEVRRIEQEYDGYHDGTMHLFELTEDEKREVERKQAIRDRIVQQITGRARRNAASELHATEGLQELKETVTGAAQYVSLGATMQEETKRTTRMADRELAFARAKQDEIDAMLADPNTTAEEREVLMRMLDLADLQQRGAERLLSDNAKITAAGYAADVVAAAAPGVGSLANVGAKALATRFLTRATARSVAAAMTERGVVELAGAGATRAATAATERILGESAASTVERVLTTDVGAAVGEAASSAATRVIGERGVETVKNIASSAAEIARTDIRDIPGKIAGGTRSAERTAAVEAAARVTGEAAESAMPAVAPEATQAAGRAGQQAAGRVGAPTAEQIAAAERNLATLEQIAKEPLGTSVGQPAARVTGEAAESAMPAVAPEATQAAGRAGQQAAGQAATATEKLPAPEMPPAIRETLGAAADEPMRTGPTGTTILERPRVPGEGAAPKTSPAREGVAATEKLPEGDFSYDLTTPQGRQALDAHIERMAAERVEGTAGAQAAREAEMLPSRIPSLYERPGFKDLPQAPQQRQGPDVGRYLTPQERAALEARARAETEAVPRVPREEPGTPRGSEPQLLDDQGRVVTEEQLQHLRMEGQRLDAALKRHYGERKIDPIHVLDRETLNRIRQGKTLTTGDINFSPEGVGVLRRGGEAIRIKPGSEKYVHFIQGDARGWIPKYYENGIIRLPNGSVDVSKGKNYIPLEHLQYFDKEAGEWVNLK